MNTPHLPFDITKNKESQNEENTPNVNSQSHIAPTIVNCKNHCKKDLWIISTGAGRSSLLLILDTKISSGVLASYKLGATNMIPQVPATHATLKIQRRILSSTMATYFQSSATWKKMTSCLQILFYFYFSREIPSILDWEIRRGF